MTIHIAADNEAFSGFPHESVSSSNAGGRCVTAGETAPTKGDAYIKGNALPESDYETATGRALYTITAMRKAYAAGQCDERKVQPEQPAMPMKNALIDALERAGAAESALRRLVDECENEGTPNWQNRMAEYIDHANRLLARNAAIAQPVKPIDAPTHSELDRIASDLQALCDRQALRLGALEAHTAQTAVSDADVISACKACSLWATGEAMKDMRRALEEFAKSRAIEAKIEEKNT